ncbi:MAG: serine hydrolase domain-containing protein [Bacteroidota bacterium]
MSRLNLIIFFLLCILILIGSCTKYQALESYAETLRVKNKIPGMAIAVVGADTILELFTLGVRRHKHPDMIQLNDRFHLGSVTKAMTSYAAGYLVEKGWIDWSTTIREVFPDWKENIDSIYWDTSLGALLSHRGRIQEFWVEEEFDSIYIEKQDKSDQRTAFIEYVLNRPPITPDSLGFRYSNAGYSIAAQMLEKAGGRSWEDLMLKIFNQDLELNIGFAWPNKTDENQPWGHWIENGQLIACPPDDDYDLDWIEPGGDVNISLPNYCKFIQLNLKGLLGEDNYLQSKTYLTLHTDFDDAVYAYGWGNTQKDDRNYSFHGGSAGTFLVNVTIDKSASVAYIIMMNTDSPRAREVVNKLVKRMEEEYG